MDEIGVAEEIRELLDTLEAVVAEQGPDYIYKKDLDASAGLRCTYVKDGKPDCIAARVLHRLGVTLDELAACEGYHCAATDSRWYLRFSSQALDVLKAAQYAQDTGQTWGAALYAAKDRALMAYRVHDRG